MKCNQCQYGGSKVIESRDVLDGSAIRRRRACLKCQHRFTTYERVERPQLLVVKNDGTREIFNRSKLLSGLQRACEKTSVTTVQLENLISRIEQKLYTCAEPEITSAQIGDMVMNELSILNDVAYVRFASVYRRFANIAGFEKELLQIKYKRQKAGSSTS